MLIPAEDGYRSERGGLRYVPLTTRLAGCLGGHRHLRDTGVPCDDDGTPLTPTLRRRLHADTASDAASVQI